MEIIFFEQTRFKDTVNCGGICAPLGRETYPSPKVWTWQFQTPMLEASWLPRF